MNDVPQEDDDRVRDLLAGLGSRGGEEQPLPPEVAVRLEDTLAALVAERSADRISQEHTATGNVVPLRPRWLPRLAAAAAAVVVLGGGGVAAASFLGHGSDATSSAGSESSARKAPSSPTGSAASGAAGGESAAQPDSGSTTAPAPSAGAERRLATDAAVPRLSSASYAADVRALLAQRPTLHKGTRTAAPAASCPGPADLAGSTTSAVLLDGTPALLVVRPASGGTRAVEVWACSGQRRLATTTVAP